MKAIICMLVLVAACSASSLVDESLESEWIFFKKMNNKVYESPEAELGRQE
jgi:hypothetical protein